MAPRSPITRILLHFGLFSLATSIAGVFSGPYLLHMGLPAAGVFLVLAAVLAVRFALRPLALSLAPRIGPRATLIVGSLVSALPWPLLARVDGPDRWLVAYVLLAGLGDAIYWTSFHATFAAAGDRDRLGRQTSLRQIVAIATNVVGPPVGGLLLTRWPMAAFVAAAALRCVAILPLLAVPDGIVARQPPPGIWRSARFGSAVFATDGWIINTAGNAWALIVFTSLGQRYDAFGGAVAAAALVGAGATWLFGHLIDTGRGWRAVIVNLLASLLVLGLQMLAGTEPPFVVGAMLVAALLGGLATPAITTAVYAEAKAAGCTFRFQFATEGGWDIGGIAACLLGALLLHWDVALPTLLLASAPALFIQAWLLRGGYRRVRASAAAAA